jgi:hypothetical protein
VWIDGTFWFETGARTRKGRNLDRDPRCVLSLATLAERWNAQGWPARVDGSRVALTADYTAPVRRPSAVDRLPDQGPAGDRTGDGRPRRGDILAVRRPSPTVGGDGPRGRSVVQDRGTPPHASASTNSLRFASHQRRLRS